MSEQQQREFFRVRCEAMVRVRSIDADAEEASVNAFRLGATDNFTLATRFAATTRESEVLFKRICTQYPDVASYLSALDSKLDVLARVLLQRELETHPGEMRDVELSAGGVGYEADGALDEGALVNLRLVLIPNYTGVEILARVVQCKACTPGSGYWIAFNFEEMRDADRELVIQHVLDRQSADLRDRKRALEAQG